MRKVAKKCYLPANKKLLELIHRHDGGFRVAYSITGLAIEQMVLSTPEVLESFLELAETGCVEFLGETYYHSLAALHNTPEFKAQVKLHSNLMEKTFGVVPRIFRNTELVYSDTIGKLAAEMGFEGVIAEGVDEVLEDRSPNFVYEVPEAGIPLLLKNYRLSDDIAFRFSNQGWKEWPLTADKFASWIHQVSGNGDTVNLFLDYETFGEHQWESTGIFDFLEHLPRFVMNNEEWDFKTPSEVIDSYQPREELSFPKLTSWADIERDLTAWQGNSMQNRALREIYDLEEKVKEIGDLESIATWRRLLTSDHFYYMCTKWFADGDVHAYFSPFESPYDAFVNFMNVVKDFRNELDALAKSREGARLSEPVEKRERSIAAGFGRHPVLSEGNGAGAAAVKSGAVLREA